MVSVEVLVAPVALVPAPSDQLRLMLFAPNGEFLRAQTTDTSDVSAQGEALLSRALRGIRSPGGFRLEEVAFRSSEDGLALVYTTVLPLADWAADVIAHDTSAHEGWVPLTPWVGRGQQRGREALPAEQVLVRNYWRRQFEETSAVLDFLPRYFTTSQARAAYASLWGEQQHVGAFHRWLHDREPPEKTPLVLLVNEESVRKDAEREFEQALADSELGPQMRIGTAGTDVGPLAGALAASSVGLSAAMVGKRGLGFLPAALVAGAIVGSHIAYQRQVARGKKPLWYTRANQRRIVIDDPYAPRPRWLPTGEEPGPFH